MYILWLNQYSSDNHDEVGGKCASLGAMMEAGLPVPPAFAVTVDAFKESMARTGADVELKKALRSVDATDIDGLQRLSELTRAMVRESKAAPSVVDAVGEAYASMCSKLGAQLPVAVRSSATAEDLPGASFAGEHDTYLWVRGAEHVIDKMVECWASLYTDRAIAYREEMNFPHDAVWMSVGVQQMVEPRVSGVAMTLNPTNGDRSKVAIDAAWGLGESVVSGEVTPDHFLIDKIVFEIVDRKVSNKEIETVVVDHEVVRRPLNGDRAGAPSLIDDEVKAVAKLARQAEKYFGRPQDVEWAIDGEGTVHLLQSRPETVWSNKPRAQVTSGVAGGLEGVVSTLLSPIRVRKP
ncbi:MAG: PEP/pyruvate-binding domain-containing protein [Myxococcota bacterium]